MNLCNFNTRVSGELTKICHIHHIEFDLYSKQNPEQQKLVREGAVEEELDDMQEVRGSNLCRGGEITISRHLTAKLCTKFAVKKKQLFAFYVTYFSDFSSTRVAVFD